MNKDIITSRYFWKATVIRALKTFLQVILGVWTAGQLVTDVNWKVTILSALSAAVYSILTSVVAGLPEVDPYEYEEDGDEDDDEE